MARNSQIIIAKNIRLDKEYKEVLNYTEQEMLALVDTNKVASATQYSFIRDKGTISTSFTYNQALQCNYMAFQNSDYNNKWFFAWIDDVRYVNDGTTEISYTIDSWSTWFSKVVVGSSFVIREHVNDDTIGLHTLPENVETGEYIRGISMQVTDTTALDCHIVIGSTYNPYTNTDVTGGIYSNVYSGIRYYLMKDNQSATNFINGCSADGKADSINCLFYAPDWLTKYNDITFGDDGYFDVMATTNTYYTYDKAINIPSTIDGYSPKNNKLFVFPYRYGMLTNNIGGNAIYKYELMPNNPRITTQAVLCPSCNIKHYMAGYKEGASNLDNGLTGFKYPVCNWATDVFTNWLTQNGVNIALDAAGGIVSLGAGIMSGNVGAAFGGTMSIANTVASVYQHRFASDTIQGNVNSGDSTFATLMYYPYFSHMSIKNEYAKVIDEYFSRYGYKINQTKVPNITGRRYWNYIQIADSETLGYGEIPQRFMDEINTIARNGTTIWHSHDNIGNYTLDNAIVN